MGVSCHFYTVYGVKLSYDDSFADAYYDANLKIAPTAIFGEDYIILGKILFDSGDLRWCEYEDSFVEIDLNSLTSIEEEYKLQFRTAFPEYAGLVYAPLKLMTLAHFT